MQYLGWFFTFAIIPAALAFGTCNQGDDSPWLVSLLFYCPIAVLGSVLLWRGASWILADYLIVLPHLGTGLLLWHILPPYWERCTFGGQHICAGMSADYGEIKASWGHPFWAPILTAIFLFVIFVAFYRGITSRAIVRT